MPLASWACRTLVTSWNNSLAHGGDEDRAASLRLGPGPRHLASGESRIADHPDFVHWPEDRAILDLGRIQPAPKLRVRFGGGEPSHLAKASLIGLAPSDQGRTRTVRLRAADRPERGRRSRYDGPAGRAWSAPEPRRGCRRGRFRRWQGSGGDLAVSPSGAAWRWRVPRLRVHALERQAYRSQFWGWVGQAGRTVQGCRRPGRQ